MIDDDLWPDEDKEEQLDPDEQLFFISKRA